MPEEQGISSCLRLVRVILIFLPRAKKAALKNIQIAFPEMGERERRQLAKSSIRVLAENVFWFACFRELKPEQVRALFDQREAAPIRERLLKSDRGTLILTPHFGNFELLAQGETVTGRPVKALVRQFDLPKLNKFWTGSREMFGMKIFGRKGGFQEMLKYLSEKEFVAVLFDQNVKRNHAAFVDLFGVPAATTKSVSLAAMRTNCQVVFVACYRNPPEEHKHGKFRIHVREIPNPNEDDDLRGLPQEEQVKGFLRKLHKELEELIRAHPEQWFWIHRRWKTRPEGEKENFYD